MAVTVKQEEGKEVMPEVLATAIKRMGDAVASWHRAGMKRRALIVLLNDSSGVNRRDIELVLNNLESLQQTWCAPKAATPAK